MSSPGDAGSAALGGGALRIHRSGSVSYTGAGAYAIKALSTPAAPSVSARRLPAPAVSSSSSSSDPSSSSYSSYRPDPALYGIAAPSSSSSSSSSFGAAAGLELSDPHLQDIAGSIAHLEAFQAELLAKDVMLSQYKHENARLAGQLERAARTHATALASEARCKELERTMQKNDALATDKQVELLRVLTAHREYEKKLLAEIQRVEAQAKDAKLGVQGQLTGLELKVQEGGAYAAHLESERKKLATELQAALAGAEAIEQSKVEAKSKVSALETKLAAMQRAQQEDKLANSDMAGRMAEQQATIDKLTWSVAKLEEDLRTAKGAQNTALERAARIEESTRSLTHETAQKDGEIKLVQQTNKQLRGEVGELKLALAAAEEKMRSAQEQLEATGADLERERMTRREWSQARLHLLQEICDEEQALTEELDAWMPDGAITAYSSPSPAEAAAYMARTSPRAADRMRMAQAQRQMAMSGGGHSPVMTPAGVR
jgi:hypothetical protein